MSGNQWYFAYGSNLFIEQKEERTGCIRQAICGRLPGFRFAFNKRGKDGRQVFANIFPDGAAEVWGVLYLCNPEAILDMDHYEGVTDGHYDRVPVTVEKQSGEIVAAITYVAGEDFVCEPGKPSLEYLRKIVTGARHHCLPGEYVAYIESLTK